MQMLSRQTRILIASLASLLVTAVAAAEDAAEPLVVAQGRKVAIEYTLTLDGGTVADTNVGAEPLVYTQGAGQVLPDLENALVGLGAGDTKQVSLTPEQGYGAVNPDFIQTVPANEIPEEARVAGMQLMAQSKSGERRPLRVREIKGEEIVLDLNHPLAGENLTFDVKIVSVE